MDQIAAFVNEAIARVPQVMVVYESTAGQGYNLGHTFEQLAALIERCEDRSRVGVCLDTCHLHAGGYDIVSEDGSGSDDDGAAPRNRAHRFARKLRTFDMAERPELAGASCGDKPSASRRELPFDIGRIPSEVDLAGRIERCRQRRHRPSPVHRVPIHR